MPMLADLHRCDITLYEPSGDHAFAVAQVAPSTVPSLFEEKSIGRHASRDDEPAVLRVLSGGTAVRRLSRGLVHGAATIQEVFPILRGGVVIAAISFEIGLIEHERQKKKSQVYRWAIERFRQGAIHGQAASAAGHTRFGEHDGPLVVDTHGKIIYISSVAEHLYRKLGFTHGLLKRDISQLQTDESVFFEAIESGTCIEKTAQEGAFIWTRWALPLSADPRLGWLRRVGLSSNRTAAVIINIRDATEDLRKEQEIRIRATMIQEIHHRVKNNLQTIASLLRLQARRTGSLEVSDMLQETINRILSIAVVHEFLAHDESNVVDVKEICQRILTEVSQGILDPEKQIRFSIEGPDLPLPAQQATSCALIVNELLQNSVRHAFQGRPEGKVIVMLQDDGDDLQIEIIDDGRGVQPGVDLRRAGGLGLQIVRTLVGEDLKGTFSISSGSPQLGVRATIRFPKAQGQARPLGVSKP